MIKSVHFFTGETRDYQGTTYFVTSCGLLIKGGKKYQAFLTQTESEVVCFNCIKSRISVGRREVVAEEIKEEVVQKRKFARALISKHESPHYSIGFVCVYCGGGHRISGRLRHTVDCVVREAKEYLKDPKEKKLDVENR